MPPKATPTPTTPTTPATPAVPPAGPAAAIKSALKGNSRRLDKAEKGVLVHLLQAPKLNNADIAKIIDVDERTISRRRKQLRTLGHLSPERNVKGAEKLRPWHLERIIKLLDENQDYQLRDVQEFLQKEFDLHVTVSTISRQLSRAGHARARRPGYKNTRPDLQAAEQATEQEDQQLQQLQQADTQMQDGPAFMTPDQQQLHSEDQGQDQAQQQQQQQQQREGDGSTEAGPTAAENMKLACPFFKVNPQRYMDAPFCQSAWHSTRDVKEHVFRQHMHPKYRCNRCLERFSTNNDLILHQRGPVPCALAEWNAEGCSEEQKEKIRKGDKGDENMRWKRMFRILFPDIEPPEGFAYDNANLFYTPAPAFYPNPAPWSGEQPA